MVPNNNRTHQLNVNNNNNNKSASADHQAPNTEGNASTNENVHHNVTPNSNGINERNQRS